MAANKELLARFMALFIGSGRSYGQFNPKTNSHLTEKAHYQEKHYIAHFRGDTGLGLVPILDDNTVRWMALDIDCHGDDEPEIDLLALESKIRELGLPLIPCRSKSGGAHCYSFFSDHVPAIMAHQAGLKWSAQLGQAGCEIFPKQTQLLMHDGELQLGNWINLPYFNRKDTNRYAVFEGEKLDLEQFLNLAESLALDRAMLQDYVTDMGEHEQAPPCFQRMLVEGVPGGHRNEALYHATVYLKRAFPADYMEKAKLFNDTVLQPPMEKNEAIKTIKSAGRRDYKYKCRQEPCKSLCDRTTCATREFGVPPTEGQGTIVDMPEITSIRKFRGAVTKYEIIVDGALIVVTGEQFLQYRMLRRHMMMALNRVVPFMNDIQFEARFLSKLLTTVVDVEIPFESTVAGTMQGRLIDFLQKAQETEDRARAQAAPILTELDGAKVYMFKWSVFVKHLKLAKMEDVRNEELARLLLPLGLEVKVVKIDGRSNLRLHVVPAEKISTAMEMRAEQYEAEF